MAGEDDLVRMLTALLGAPAGAPGANLAAFPFGGAMPERAPDVSQPPFVALRLDPSTRTYSWVTLADDAPRMEALDSIFDALGMAAASNWVAPRTYGVIQRALGFESPIDVAPSPLKRSFCGARIIIWTRDKPFGDSDPAPVHLPSIRFSFSGKPDGGHWMGTCFVVAYPKLPAQLPPAERFPDSPFMVRPGMAPYIVPLDTRATLQSALDDGTFSVDWLTAEEAARMPPAMVSMQMVQTPTADGGTMSQPKETLLRYHCAVCDKPCSKQCSRCNAVPYCSATCQKSAWRQHKLVCVPSGN